MAEQEDLQYTEPEPLTPEQIREKLLKMDRESRLEFMWLTAEPPDPSELTRARTSRKRRKRPLAA
jgi:hypothetical protein